MKNTEDTPGDVPRKLSLPPSIHSEMCRRKLAREDVARKTPGELTEAIIAKVNPNQIPREPQKIKEWLESRKPRAQPELAYDE